MTDRLRTGSEASEDVIVAMQHRNRLAVHDINVVRSLLMGRAALIAREGVKDEERLIQSLSRCCSLLEKITEAMQSE